MKLYPIVGTASPAVALSGCTLHIGSGPRPIPAVTATAAQGAATSPAVAPATSPTNVARTDRAAGHLFTLWPGVPARPGRRHARAGRDAVGMTARTNPAGVPGGTGAHPASLGGSQAGVPGWWRGLPGIPGGRSGGAGRVAGPARHPWGGGAGVLGGLRGLPGIPFNRHRRWAGRRRGYLAEPGGGNRRRAATSSNIPAARTGSTIPPSFVTLTASSSITSGTA
jgi:hypothetical protein